MLEFFIALFGGVFWTSRISAERSADKAADVRMKKDIDNAKRKRETWYEEVCDEELEKEMKNVASSGWREEPYFTEIKTAINEINAYSGSYERICELLDSGNLPRFSHMFYDLRVLILMVNRGKLPGYVAWWGFSPAEKEKSLYKLASSKKEGWRCHYDLFLWTTKKLEEKGFVLKPVQCYRGMDYKALNDKNRGLLNNCLWDSMVPDYVTIKEG